VPPPRLRALLPVGAASGLAAAFNTPIAGVTFTLEEILGDTAARSMGSIVIASVVASVVERSLLGEHALFSVPAYRMAGVVELPFYLALGVASGLAAAAFNSSLLRLRRRFREQRRIPAWATPAAGGLLVGVLGLAGLWLTGCAGVFGVGYQDLAVGLRGELPIKALAVLCLLKLAATVVSYGSGASGGVFGPSLFIGGMLGGLAGAGAGLALPGHSTQPGAFALVGMGAVFAGIVRAPITSIVMIFEMTNNYSIILPLMAANVTSFAVARRLVPAPIYDALLEQDGIHLPRPGGDHMKRLRVGSAMVRSFVALDARATVAEALELIRGAGPAREAYPMVGADGRFVGMVSRRTVERAELTGRREGAVQDLERLPSAAVHADEPLDVALAAIGRHQAVEVPVVSRSRPARLLGLVTLRAVAASVTRAVDAERASP
jgi:CIC family chloride channel protein